MDPTVSTISSDQDFLKFTLSNTKTCFANALRRIIIAEIPCVVFRTSPDEVNKVDIEINTSRLNNELIKQRLSCIPIHISDIGFPINDYEVILDVKNESQSIIYATTEHFQIRNMKTESDLPREEVKKIFPADLITNDYIQIVRLRPKISDEIHGEHIKLSCKFDIGSAKENGSFNVVSTCSYAATKDEAAAKIAWDKMASDFKSKGVDPSEIEFKYLDWEQIDAKRITIPNSYDFIIESIGIFTNEEIVVKACHVMFSKLDNMKLLIESNDLKIIKSKTTMSNCYDVIFKNEDYTLGSVLENILYEKYYQKTINFCGFNKPHPHINESILRINFMDDSNEDTLKIILIETISETEQIFNKIASNFT